MGFEAGVAPFDPEFRCCDQPEVAGEVGPVAVAPQPAAGVEDVEQDALDLEALLLVLTPRVCDVVLDRGCFEEHAHQWHDDTCHVLHGAAEGVDHGVRVGHLQGSLFPLSDRGRVRDGAHERCEQQSGLRPEEVEDRAFGDLGCFGDLSGRWWCRRSPTR